MRRLPLEKGVIDLSAFYSNKTDARAVSAAFFAGTKRCVGFVICGQKLYNKKTMRKIALTLFLACSAGFTAGCSATATNTPTNTPNKNTPTTATKTTTPAEPPTIVSGHGNNVAPPASSKTNSTPTASDNTGTPSDEETALIPKPLQDKVVAAEAKAKAPNASAADKVATAKLLIERGNVFYQAGNPRLYKYALRDFRRAVKLDPTNAEAISKRDQIVQIYQSMGRPVPTLGEDN